MSVGDILFPGGMWPYQIENVMGMYKWSLTLCFVSEDHLKSDKIFHCPHVE